MVTGGQSVGYGRVEGADNRFTARIAGIAFPRTREGNPFQSQVPPVQCQGSMGTGGAIR
jgi:hypothetical protein